MQGLPDEAGPDLRTALIAQKGFQPLGIERHAKQSSRQNGLLRCGGDLHLSMQIELTDDRQGKLGQLAVLGRFVDVRASSLRKIVPISSRALMFSRKAVVYGLLRPSPSSAVCPA